VRVRGSVTREHGLVVRARARLVRGTQSGDGWLGLFGWPVGLVVHHIDPPVNQTDRATAPLPHGSILRALATEP
jgi:hypothetical protein